MVKSHAVHDAAVGSGSGRIHSMPPGVHHHHQPVDPVAQAHAVFAFYVIMVTMIGMQLGLVWWKRVHKRSYELVTLMGLWLVPAVISVVLHFWLFVLVWFAYSLTSAVYLSFCMVKKLNPATPRMVYQWFLGVHKVCSVVGVTGYILLFIEVMGLGVMLETFLPKGLFLQAVWYGLYFGVLNRDAAEVAADRMSVLMGTRRKLAVSVNKCGICDGDLNDFSHLQAVQAPAQPQPQRPQAVQLACKHLFHDHCIRGWTIVGKKDTCPTCMEKVDFKALYNDRPWETRNMTWIQMLDFVRYMVVWNPILLLALHFFFNWLGFGHEGDHLAPHAHAAYSLNDTFAELNSSAGNHTALLQMLQRIPPDATANASLTVAPSNALLNGSMA